MKQIMLNPILLNLCVPSKHRYHSSLEATKNIKLDLQVTKRGKVTNCCLICYTIKALLYEISSAVSRRQSAEKAAQAPMLN